jgi:hypothetical protein
VITGNVPIATTRTLLPGGITTTDIDIDLILIELSENIPTRNRFSSLTATIESNPPNPLRFALAGFIFERILNEFK